MDCNDADWELANTQPTTPAGIVAALTYRTDDDGDLNPVRYWTLVCAAYAIAGLPEPPMTGDVAPYFKDDEA